MPATFAILSQTDLSVAVTASPACRCWQPHQLGSALRWPSLVLVPSSRLWRPSRAGSSTPLKDPRLSSSPWRACSSCVASFLISEQSLPIDQPTFTHLSSLSKIPGGRPSLLASPRWRWWSSASCSPTAPALATTFTPLAATPLAALMIRCATIHHSHLPVSTTLATSQASCSRFYTSAGHPLAAVGWSFDTAAVIAAHLLMAVAPLGSCSGTSRG